MASLSPGSHAVAGTAQGEAGDLRQPCSPLDEVEEQLVDPVPVGVGEPMGRTLDDLELVVLHKLGCANGRSLVGDDLVGITVMIKVGTSICLTSSVKSVLPKASAHARVPWALPMMRCRRSGGAGLADDVVVVSVDTEEGAGEVGREPDAILLEIACSRASNTCVTILRTPGSGKPGRLTEGPEAEAAHRGRLPGARRAVIAMIGVDDASAAPSADISVAIGITGADVSEEAPTMVVGRRQLRDNRLTQSKNRRFNDNIRCFLRLSPRPTRARS